MSGQRLIDANELKERLKHLEGKGGHKYYRKGIDDCLHYHMPCIIDDQPTIDPETLPIVRELRGQLAKVTAERDALKSNPPVKVDSDAFELAARLAEVTAERDDLKKNARPVVRGEWKNIGGDEWVCTACGFVISTERSWEKPEKKFCEDCGADMRGDPK